MPNRVPVVDAHPSIPKYAGGDDAYHNEVAKLGQSFAVMPREQLDADLRWLKVHTPFHHSRHRLVADTCRADLVLTTWTRLTAVGTTASR